MKNSYRINYIFLLLSLGIVSTILSTPVLGQTQNNSQNQQGQTGGAGPYTSGKPDIESAQELESITNDTDTKTSNDTTPMMQELGKETQSGNQTSGGQQQQQQGNQTSGGQQQQQQGNQTSGGQQGNQSDNPLSNVGKAIGDLFK